MGADDEGDLGLDGGGDGCTALWTEGIKWH